MGEKLWKIQVKDFVVQKSITEMKHPPCFRTLAPNDLWLFPKINCTLKGRRFQDTENIKKKVTVALEAIPEQEIQNVSNSDSIVGLST
jgi:hypothetical protein